MEFNSGFKGLKKMLFSVTFKCTSIMYRIMIYRVIQKERSIFREVILLVTVRKKVHMNMGLILVTEIELSESTSTKTW